MDNKLCKSCTRMTLWLFAREAMLRDDDFFSLWIATGGLENFIFNGTVECAFVVDDNCCNIVAVLLIQLLRDQAFLYALDRNAFRAKLMVIDSSIARLSLSLRAWLECLSRKIDGNWLESHCCLWKSVLLSLMLGLICMHSIGTPVVQNKLQCH